MYYADTTNLIVSSAQDIGQVAATYVSTNKIDLQATPVLRDLSIRPMFFRLIFPEAVAGVGASIQFDLVSDADSALGSPTIHSSVLLSVASGRMAIGKELVIALPPGQTYERYLGLQYVVSGATTTAGTVTAILVPSVDSTAYFPDGSSIVAG
jgi:hypothetical protein